MNRYRNPSGPVMAVPIRVRAISRATGRTPTYWCRPRPITARCQICVFLFPTRICGWRRGGWTRQVTSRELGGSKTIAGVNMLLNAGGGLVVHWHQAATSAYMHSGSVLSAGIDPEVRNVVEAVGVGELWFFPPGIPHSIQGINPGGCEFLLVFDDGDFDEENTFLISDRFKHVPTDVLG